MDQARAARSSGSSPAVKRRLVSRLKTRGRLLLTQASPSQSFHLLPRWSIFLPDQEPDLDRWIFPRSSYSTQRIRSPARQHKRP